MGYNVVFEGCRNYGNTKFPNRKYRPVTSNVGNPIWKFGVLKSTSKMGKVTSPTGKAILLVNLFLFFFLLFDCFAGYMWIIKRYNGKVLTVNGFYALKCIGTHLYHPIVPDTNHWEKRNFRNSQSPEQGISVASVA